MTDLSLNELPEVFVSHAAITKAVSQAVARGTLRKIGSRLYTRNFEEAPEALVRRNWYHLITAYFPDAIISDRTAIENAPAADGSVFLVSKKKNEVKLPGLTFRPRRGPPPQPDDRPFIGGAYISSPARAYLENMRPSRARAGRTARTLSRPELEERLDGLLRRQGVDALNRMRDDARSLAPALGLENEAEKLGTLIGTLAGTRDAKLESPVARARAAGRAFDPDRITLFETLFAALREFVPERRPVGRRTAKENANLSFFEAYFSNFIEGTEFEVSEAVEIVFKGLIPSERPADAHDVLGTYRLVSDRAEMKTRPKSADDLIAILQRRHGTFMAGRPDKNPGQFKTQVNRAGGTVFVAPDLVTGTLEQGFGFLDALAEPFCRAVFMMFLVAEVHPFADGNGRAARIMMNAELIAEGEERIIIPPVYRANYLTALKALSQNGNATPLIRMLDFAQRYTYAIDWKGFERTWQILTRSNAFEDGEQTRLLMPEPDSAAE